MKRKSTTSNIPSPCISVCTMDDDTGFCRGCYRTLREIADWERYDDTQKQQVLDLLPARHP